MRILPPGVLKSQAHRGLHEPKAQGHFRIRMLIFCSMFIFSKDWGEMGVVKSRGLNRNPEHLASSPGVLASPCTPQVSPTLL